MTFKNDLTTHHPYSLEPQETKWPFPNGIFNLEMHESDDEVALIDTKWQSRVRLIDHEDGHDLRNVPPLSGHGLDPVQEKIDMDWFTKKLTKKVPVKIILADQSTIAGLGNRLW
jgi:formamidopyrimidine-DNA glycosylase